MKEKYVYQKNFFLRTVCDQAHLKPELNALLRDPDHAFYCDSSVVLKQDQGSDVVNVLCDSQSYVVKRYNTQNAWHFFRRLLRKTRAMRSWDNAQKLAQFHINTPKPIACIEKRLGIFRLRSYYITEYVSDPDICDLNHHTKDDVVIIVNQIVSMLAHLHQQGYVHGDMKCSNILFSMDKGVTLLDLDGMHRPVFFKQRKRAKDQKRLKKRWRNNASIMAIFEQAFLKIFS